MAALRTLPDASVHVCATSPPYFGLRAYLPADHPDKALEIGTEPTLAEYVERLLTIFREVRRVLHPTATLWLNLSDSYATNPGNGRGGEGVRRLLPLTGGVPHRSGRDRRTEAKPKDLLMVPARVALALQDDGWWLRSDIAWVKTAAMPESVTDRPTSAWEHVFLLAKSARYYYDADAVREPSSENSHGSPRVNPGDKADAGGATTNGHGATSLGRWTAEDAVRGRNLRNYWLLGPEPLADDHYAAWPTEIPRRAVLAGSSEKGVCPACGNPWRRVTERDNPRASAAYRARAVTPKMTAPLPGRDEAWQARTGLARPGWREHPAATATTVGWEPTCRHGHAPIPAVVLDPFSGSGRTGIVALRLGRRYVGIELSEYQAAKSRARVEADCPMFNSQPTEEAAGE